MWTETTSAITKLEQRVGEVEDQLNKDDDEEDLDSIDATETIRIEKPSIGDKPDSSVDSATDSIEENPVGNNNNNKEPEEADEEEGEEKSGSASGEESQDKEA